MFTRVCDSVQGGSRSLSRGGVSVLGGLCPGCLCHGDPPPYGNERAVRILLECVLVHLLFPLPRSLIQNAEDAGATHVKILYDEHQYPDDPEFLKNAKLAQFQVTHSERNSGRKA